MASAAPMDVSEPNKSETVPKNEKIIFLNYDLECFRYIPRTAFLFEVCPIEGFEDKYDAEYLLIDPEYTSITSADRFSGPGVIPKAVPSRLMVQQSLRLANIAISSLIDEYRKSTKTVRELVANSNIRLREAQAKKFVHRATLLEQGTSYDGSTDRELSQAFFKEFHIVGSNIDHRSILTRSLLDESREKGLIEQAENLRKQACARGVPQLPPFWLQRNLHNDLLNLSPEEEEWLKDPTIAWSPRQFGVGLSVQASSDAPHYYTQTSIPLLPGYSEQGAALTYQPFKLPTYQEYQNINPVYGHRKLPNRQVEIIVSLFPFSYIRPISSADLFRP